MPILQDRGINAIKIFETCQCIYSESRKYFAHNYIYWAAPMWNCSINGPRFHNLLLMMIVGSRSTQVSTYRNVEKWNLSKYTYSNFIYISANSEEISYYWQAIRLGDGKWYYGSTSSYHTTYVYKSFCVYSKHVSWI